MYAGSETLPGAVDMHIWFCRSAVQTIIGADERLRLRLLYMLWLNVAYWVVGYDSCFSRVWIWICGCVRGCG